MATSPIYSWPEPDNTDLVKNGALAIRTLGNAIDTTMGTMVAKTVVDAKGDLIAGTAADTVNRLAVGANGETLVADSSATTGLRYQSGYNGNAIINGGMDIWQRGTSIAVTSTSTSFYGADRWQIFSASTGRTVSRQVTGDTTNLPNIQYCQRIARDSGNINTAAILPAYSMESADAIRFAGQLVTFSFYARAGANYSATSNALVAKLRTGTGTDQNLNAGYTGSVDPITVTATLTTSWQRFYGNATLAATVTEAGVQFNFTPTGTAGAADFVEITGVQVEFGAIPTSFKRSSGGTIQGELAACQRYFQTFPSDGTTSGSAIGQFYNTTTARLFRQLPVTMRAVGTATFPTVYTNAIEEAGVAFRTPTGFSVVYAGPDTLGFNATGMSGGTTNAMAIYVLGNKISVSAEL